MAALSPQAQEPHAQVMQLSRGEIAAVLRRRLAQRLPVLPVLRVFYLIRPAVREGKFNIRRKEKIKQTHRLTVTVTEHVTNKPEAFMPLRYMLSTTDKYGHSFTYMGFKNKKQKQRNITIVVFLPTCLMDTQVMEMCGFGGNETRRSKK